MQNYSEPESRMIRLPSWAADGSVSAGGRGTVYSNRQPYLGFSLSGIPGQHNPPPVQIFYPPANNSRLPVFHLMSSAPGRGPVVQSHQQLGLATGIGSSSASTSQTQRKEPVIVTKTLPIPTERRQRKSVNIIRKCNNENDTASSTGKGNAPSNKRPRGRPPGKKNKLPSTTVSPPSQSLGTDSPSMTNCERSEYPASNELYEQNPQLGVCSTANLDCTKFNKISDSHQRCIELIEYIRERTSDAPERFNKFLDLMKLYRENGDWKTLFVSTDELFHDYPEVLFAVKELVSSTSANLLDDSYKNNDNQVPFMTRTLNARKTCLQSNSVGVERFTDQRPILPSQHVLDAMDTGAGIPENIGHRNNSRSDQSLIAEGSCVPNREANLSDPTTITHTQRQQCFETQGAATHLGAEMVETSVENVELFEDTNMRENILEVCGELDEMSTSTLIADAESNDEQEQAVKITTPFPTKKYCKLASDPKLYRLLSAIHLFGATKNDILVKNNGRNITNKKLEDKLSKLIMNEIDEAKWKIQLLCTAYPALDKSPHSFLCLQQLLQYYDPLPCKDAEKTLSKSKAEETENDGSYSVKVFDYESFDRLDKSYYQYPESFVHPKTGSDENGSKVLNTQYFSVASIKSQARAKSDDEQTTEIIEDVRYELDMLDHACSRAIEVLTNFEKKKVVPMDGHRKAVQLIYANDGNIILEGIEKQPELFVPPVLQWIKVKKNEWTELRNRWNVNVNEKLRDMNKRAEEMLDDCNCEPDEDVEESFHLGKVQFCRNLGLHSIKST